MLGGQRAFALLAGAGAGHHFVHELLDGGHQRQLAGHRALHQPAGDDQAVDLVGAFEDAVDARIAVGALGRILLDVAVAGEDLHDVVHHHVEHLGAPDLQDGALDGVLLDALLDLARGALGVGVDIGQGGVDHADGAVDQRFADVDAGGAFGELFLDEAELGDGLAEGLALLGVADARPASRCARRRRRPRPA